MLKLLGKDAYGGGGTHIRRRLASVRCATTQCNAPQRDTTQQQPLELHYAPTPNGWKVTLLLEESGMPYIVKPVDMAAGDQHTPYFLKLSPNGCMPALYDPNVGSNYFESGAIMWHIAETYPAARRFLPPEEKAAVVQWLFWVNAGLGPMAGQLSHFKYYAPQLAPNADHSYSLERYRLEYDRLLSVIERHLGATDAQYLAGPSYSIADMAAWPWVKPWRRWMGCGLDEGGYPLAHAWYERIKARPATARAIGVMRDEAKADQKLRDEGGMSSAALGAMFRQHGNATRAFSRAGATRGLASSAAAPSPAAEGVAIPEKMESILRARWEDLDGEGSILEVPPSDAPLIWHKHSSFLDHLREVWVMLCNWEQPEAVCRLGLLHSAYSNSFVSMNCFDPTTDRDRVRALIGDAAENLVYKFCSIDRQSLEQTVLDEGTIRRGGYTMTHIHTGAPLAVSGDEAAAFVTETLADETDQRFGWQSDLEVGATAAVWPGPALPTLRLGRTSRLAHALRSSGLVDEASLPPIFNRCTDLLSVDDEVAARDAYWQAISLGGVSPSDERRDPTRSLGQLDALAEAARRNPFVAEPHVVRAQICLQLERWEEAETAARRGVELLCTWGTQWDKRMPFNAWLNWSRCLALQASTREWPTTHGGIESLGATLPRMRFRKLNDERSMSRSSR